MGALIEKAGTAVPSEEDARLAAESSRVLALRRPDQDIGVYAFEGSEKRGQRRKGVRVNCYAIHRRWGHGY